MFSSGLVLCSRYGLSILSLLTLHCCALSLTGGFADFFSFFFIFCNIQISWMSPLK